MTQSPRASAIEAARHRLRRVQWLKLPTLPFLFAVIVILAVAEIVGCAARGFWLGLCDGVANVRDELR